MMGMRAKKICMAMLLIVGGIVAVFLAHRKVAEKITEEELVLEYRRERNSNKIWIRKSR